MGEVTEVRLPGIGVRHEFDTADGVRVGVLTHRGGRRELLVYAEDDPDRCRTTVQLDSDDTRTLAELLGASQVSESVAAMERIAGLAIAWLPVETDAIGAGGRAIADLAMRTQTGVSIIAVLRGDTPIPAPEPTELLLPGDIAVVAGTPEGIERARALLT
jgi:TrkA domain protein